MHSQVQMVTEGLKEIAKEASIQLIKKTKRR